MVSDLICFDSSGAPLEYLTQWDVDQVLVVKGADISSAPMVHFCNINSEKALPVQSTIVDGCITVDIPNLLLQSGLPIIAYLYYHEESGEAKTLYRVIIPVNPRPMPDDYEYEENIGYTSWVEIESRIEEIFQQLDSIEETLDVGTSTPSADMTNYYTKQEVDGLIPDLSGYATETFVVAKIAEAQISGGSSSNIDMSAFVTKDEIPTKVSELENDAGYLTEHQDISGKLDADKLQDAINATLAQAKASGEFDGDDYVLTESDKNEIAEIAADMVESAAGGESSPGVNVDLSNYYTKREVDDLIPEPIDMTGYVTASELESKGYLTEHQDLSSYAKKEELPSSLPASDVYAWAKEPNKPSYTASEIGAMSESVVIPRKVSELTNDSGFITGYTETDPTVPKWAKSSTKPSYTASEVGALPDTTVIPSKTSDLVNDSGFITGYSETDPTVPSWAKRSTKPTYTAEEVGALPSTTVIPIVPENISAFHNDSGYITGEHAHKADDVTSGTFAEERIPIISMDKGGTGATDGTTGLQNLFAAGATILSSNQYGDTLPPAGTAGRIFFLSVVK